MTIRRVRADEGATLLALWKAAGATPSPTDTLEEIERALSSARIECFVAEVGAQAVGSIIAAFDGWRGHIYRLAVHPAFRRKGVARRLVDRAHESFARWGTKRITALVHDPILGTEHAGLFADTQNGSRPTFRHESKVSTTPNLASNSSRARVSGTASAKLLPAPGTSSRSLDIRRR